MTVNSQVTILADLNGEIESLYFRGARRSGKTELLLATVAELVERDHRVTIIASCAAETRDALARLREKVSCELDLETTYLSDRGVTVRATERIGAGEIVRSDSLSSRCDCNAPLRTTFRPGEAALVECRSCGACWEWGTP